jgi:hypothetical protein
MVRIRVRIRVRVRVRVRVGVLDDLCKMPGENFYLQN